MQAINNGKKFLFKCKVSKLVFWKEVCMSLAAINSQYAGLNGLSGYGTSFLGTSGLYSDAYVENAKTNIANAYDVSATSSSYSNKSSVSSSSFAQQCQAIEYLLQQGRTDDAMAKYDTLYNDMASNSYYQGYTENEIKTLLQEKYLDATGTTIVNDVSANSSSAFETGVQSSIPVIGLLFNNNSSDDFIAEATGTETSGWSKLKTGVGVATGVAASAAAGTGISKLAGLLKGFTTSGKTLSKVLNAVSGKGKAAAIIAGGAALLTYIGGKIIKSND